MVDITNELATISIHRKPCICINIHAELPVTRNYTQSTVFMSAITKLMLRVLLIYTRLLN